MLSENVAFTVLIRLRPAKSKYNRKNSFKHKKNSTKIKNVRNSTTCINNSPLLILTFLRQNKLNANYHLDREQQDTRYFLLISIEIDKIRAHLVTNFMYATGLLSNCQFKLS